MSLVPKITFGLLMAFGSASAATLGAASPFNVVSFGSLSSTSDIAGRVAVQGTVNGPLDVGSAEVQNNFNNAGPAYQFPYTTVLNSGNNGNLVRQLTGGDVYAPGYNPATNLIQIQNGTGSVVTGGVSPIDWAALFADITDLSTFLKTASAHTVGGVSNVVVNTAGQTDNVMTNVQLYRLSATQFSNLGSIVTNGKTVLIDVDFTGLAVNGTINTSHSNFFVDGQQPFANNAAAKRVLFNICPGLSASACSASTLNLNVGWYGTLIAPTATVQGNSQFNGQMVVGNLNFQGEIHAMAFQGDLPVPSDPVPEPSAMALSALGLGGLAFYRRRRA